MDISDQNTGNELPAKQLALLQRRHFQGALVRSGASVLMWLFALGAYLADVIKTNHFVGISASVLYLILINPPTLLLLKHVKGAISARAASLLVNILEVIGYTAVIYFTGGVEAAFLTPIYAALIAYVGVFAPPSFPLIVALLASVSFSTMVIGEHLGLIPAVRVLSTAAPPWPYQVLVLTVVFGLLLVAAFISSFTAGILKNNRDKLRGQNVELKEKAASLREANDRLNAEIRERQRAEEALRESERTQKAIVQTTPDLIFRFNKKGVYTYFKPPTDFTTHVTGDPVGKNMYDVMPREIIDERMKMAGQVWDQGIAIEHEYWFKDGDETRYRWSKYVIWDDEEILVAVRDISARKRAAAEKEKLDLQIQQALKAESLGRMAGAIAHNYNNLIGIVLGNLDLALEELSPGSKPSEHIATAKTASVRASEISHLLLAYLGLGRGKREPLSLSEVCRAAASTYSGKTRMRTEFPAPGPLVRANEAQIRQMVMNLIVNADEAIGDGDGEIFLAMKEVAAADIHLSRHFPVGWTPTAEAYACLTVTDTGTGMNKETVDKIFDPFFTTKFTGRGLGLPVVMGIVKSHEGAVTVQSSPDHGTRFQVFLPIIGQAPQISETPLLDAGGTRLL